MNRTSFPTHANADIIEATYQAWLKDHNSVDPTWRAFFQGFTLGANWYLNNWFKLSLDLERTSFTGGAAGGNRPDENVAIARFQAAL